MDKALHVNPEKMRKLDEVSSLFNTTASRSESRYCCTVSTTAVSTDRAWGKGAQTIYFFKNKLSIQHYLDQIKTLKDSKCSKDLSKYNL